MRKLTAILLSLLLIPSLAFGAASRSFDNSNDRVDFGDPADGHLDFGTGDLSIYIWVITADTDSFVLSKRANSTAVGYEFLVGGGSTAGDMYFRYGGATTGSNYTYSDPAGTTTTWVNMIGVLKYGTSATYYLNATQSSKGMQFNTVSPGSTSSTTALAIGERGGGDGDYSGLAAYAIVMSFAANADYIRTEIFWLPEMAAAFGSVRLFAPLWGDSPELDFSGYGTAGTVTGATTSSDGPPVMFGMGLPL